MKIRYIRLLIKILSVIMLVLLGWLVVHLYRIGVFNDTDSLIKLLKKYGIWAPILFVFVQIVQVVIPILPGGVSLAAGVVMFGPWLGFLYNYIGIVLGSMILFWLGRRYGRRVIDIFVSEDTLNKYMDRLDSKGWYWTFALLIFSPVAPDDALVLLTSLTKMTWHEFTIIILAGKPLSIFIYSLGMLYGANWLLRMFGH
ncbi:TVP38/TMEM64 family protein [Weissella paramesenteroides]|uniref:TVP38/TMEM64 family membrane protein n=1 Tax=Weissella paramesenteroides ATCC 33313 TaxID=585506 RepID=C5R9R1_WEIPA|nr:TVP38/TMEM64 family protein [Weissella paramesenteroides]ATF42078.1 TVP38/TMEM64 family protein [Weissella paramesenteroides]EER75161.1 SNARE-like domain protein [Weissella paramesenteroides ATCC 33313]